MFFAIAWDYAWHCLREIDVTLLFSDSPLYLRTHERASKDSSDLDAVTAADVANSVR